jgi:hypothetical protein
VESEERRQKLNYFERKNEMAKNTYRVEDQFHRKREKKRRPDSD